MLLRQRLSDLWESQAFMQVEQMLDTVVDGLGAHTPPLAYLVLGTVQYLLDKHAAAIPTLLLVAHRPLETAAADYCWLLLTAAGCC